MSESFNNVPKTNYAIVRYVDELPGNLGYGNQIAIRFTRITHPTRGYPSTGEVVNLGRGVQLKNMPTACTHCPFYGNVRVALNPDASGQVRTSCSRLKYDGVTTSTKARLTITEYIQGDLADGPLSFEAVQYARNLGAHCLKETGELFVDANGDTLTVSHRPGRK